MNLFKRLAALVLAVMLVIGLFPVSAGAAKQTHETLETSFVNPLYADLVPEDVLLPKSHSKPQTYDVHNYTEDLDVAAEALREGMKSRQEAVTIYVFDTEATQESFDALVKEIFAIALEHTGKPKATISAGNGAASTPMPMSTVPKTAITSTSPILSHTTPPQRKRKRLMPRSRSCWTSWIWTKRQTTRRSRQFTITSAPMSNTITTIWKMRLTPISLPPMRR